MDETKRGLMQFLGAGFLSPRGFGDRSIETRFSGLQLISVTDEPFRAKGDGVTDDTRAFVDAINFIKNLAETAVPEAVVPAILVPAGRYKISSTIYTKPWIKLISFGSVILDWSAADENVIGIICDNDSSLKSSRVLKFSSNASPFLCGDNGTISILGPSSKKNGRSIGLKIGNGQRGSSPFRLAKISNIQFSGWFVANYIESNDTYLFSARDCHYEINVFSIKTGAGLQFNSGERMSWDNCVFAGCSVCLSVDIDSFDADFLNCSFDYVGSVVKFSQHAQYCDIKFFSCHMEAIDDFVVDALLVKKTIDVAQLGLYFFGLDLLMTAWHKELVKWPGSPTRTLFVGPISLAFNSLKRDVVFRPVLEDGYLIDSSCRVIGHLSEPISPYCACPSFDSIVNEDPFFQADELGPIVDGLKYWVFYDSNLARSVSKRVNYIDGKKVLFFSSSVESAILFSGRHKTPCLPGDLFCSSVALRLLAARGRVLIKTYLEFYDSSGSLIPTQKNTDFYSMRDANNDIYKDSSGKGGGFISSNGMLSRAPPGARFWLMHVQINSFSGQFCLSRARVWKI